MKCLLDSHTILRFITGSATFAYGLSRMIGSNNQPLINDVRNILVPTMAVFAEINSKKVTR